MSFRLVRTLMERDLVDELRLMVYPVVSEPAGAPVQQDQRQEAHAPPRLPDCRWRPRLPRLQGHPGDGLELTHNGTDTVSAITNERGALFRCPLADGKRHPPSASGTTADGCPNLQERVGVRTNRGIMRSVFRAISTSCG